MKDNWITGFIFGGFVTMLLTSAMYLTDRPHWDDEDAEYFVKRGYDAGINKAKSEILAMDSRGDKELEQ